MNQNFRNIIAVIAGIAAGSAINMGIVAVGESLIPSPAGADTSTIEALENSMHLFEPKHFLMPFLAHALGTLAGAWVAAMIAVHKKMRSAMLAGVFFLFGGITAVVMLPAPLWFSITDLVCAYLPMAFLGGKLGGDGKS